MEMEPMESLERLPMRPTRKGRSRRPYPVSLLLKEVDEDESWRLMGDGQQPPEPDYVRFPLSEPSYCPFSLRKQRRWELEELCESKERLVEAQTSAYRLSAVYSHVLPKNHITAYSRLKCHLRPLSYATVKKDKNGESKYEYRQASKTYANSSILVDPSPPQPKRKRSRRIRARRGGQRWNFLNYNGDDSESEDESLTWDTKNHVTLHFVHSLPSPGYAKASFAKIAAEDCDCRESKHRRRRNAKQVLAETLREDWDIPAGSYSDASESEWDVESPRPSTSASLSDFIFTSKSKRPKKGKRAKAQSVPVSEWFYAEEEDAGWVSGGEEEEVEAPAALPHFPVLPSLRFLLHNAELDSLELESTYEERYWECGVYPRRFVVDVSAAVGDTLRIAHGPDAALRHVRVLVSAMLEPPSPSLVRLTDHLPQDPDGWSFVNVTVSASFTEAMDQGTLDLKLDRDCEVTLNDVLKAVAIQLGTMPLAIFTRREVPTTPAMRVAAKRPAFMFGVAESEAIPAGKAESLLLASLPTVDGGSDSGLSGDSWTFMDEEAECGVCLGAGEGAALGGCRHFFCLECWRGHVGARVAGSSGVVGCMEAGCGEVADRDALSGLIPVPLLEMVENLQIATLLLASPDWAYCPNVHCSALHRVRQHQGMVLGCGCGSSWCRECGSAPHWPASCSDTDAYGEQLELNGDDRLHLDDQSRKVRVKRCPHCGTRMEKGEGCNHMSCRCGQSFCWGCGGKWESGRHYNCSISDDRFETVVLVDVVKGLKRRPGMLTAAKYEKAVAHRHAIFRFHDVPDPNVDLRKLKHPGGLAGSVTREAQKEMGDSSLSSFLRPLVSLSVSAHSLLQWSWVSGLGEPWEVRAARDGLVFLLALLDQSLIAQATPLSLPRLRRLRSLSSRLKPLLYSFAHILSQRRSLPPPLPSPSPGYAASAPSPPG